MLQRHQRNNLDQLIAFAREELQRDFAQLKDNTSKTVHLSKTAGLILDMYENLSYPLVGLQVIKENMTNIKHPHSLQIQMILDKAELFYLQSVKHDLGKLRIDQKIQHPNAEDIKQCIEQINWKLGFQRESVLNQSQQIGDNIDLMKFFEGVRNFQNWEQNLEKRTIEKLKKFANSTQNQLTLRKGFIISKLESNLINLQRKSKHEFLKKMQRVQKMSAKLCIFSKISQRSLNQSFTLIKTITCSKNLTGKIQQLFKKGSIKMDHLTLMSCFRNLTRLMKKSAKLFKIMEKISQKKILLYQFTFMKNINTSMLKKYEKIGRGTEKLGKICKRIGIKTIIKALSIRYYNLTRVLNKFYFNQLIWALDLIIKKVAEKQAMKSAISQKIKGKILLSIQRRENKPVNIRKAFLNWYLKSHEENYSKKIYNIWLNGSISKFTFLMRIKNTINEGRRQKVKQELKYFLMVFMQNMNGYYKFCQKGFINKWLQWHRYCKKLMNLIQLLASKTKKIDDGIQKQAFRAIVETSKKITLLQSYFRKRIQRMQSNFTTSFNIWKSIPNVKKAKGQIRLVSFFREKLAQANADQKQTFETFKYYKAAGKEKKIKLMVKILTKDLVYLSSFFNMWRRNLLQSKRQEAQEIMSKQNALTMISMKENHLSHQKIRQAIHKLMVITKLRKRRSETLAKTLKQLINNTCMSNEKQTFLKFKEEYEKGRAKKLKIIFWLVAANKEKQSKVLQIWNASAQVKKSAERDKKLQSLFLRANEAFKSNFAKVVHSPYVFSYLQKCYNNYRGNILSSIRTLNNLPPRMKRHKKKSMVDLADKLIFYVRKDQSKIYQIFKQNRVQGQFRKKKLVQNMVAKWTTCLRGKFCLYRQNIQKIKSEQKNKKIIQLFETCNQNSRIALAIVFEGESMKEKKSLCFTKLNYRLQQKLRQTLKLWHATSKTLVYLFKINQEKKRRVLGILEKIHQKTSTFESKRCISHFLKNSKIIQLQTNFLRKLCDSQAGKVSKALLIWKGLPQPKNKELTIKASAFERNLHRYATKVIRAAMNKFKDDLYFGNDKKKMAIRTLVARSCSGIQKYFAIWKKNNKLSLLFCQCHRLESVMNTILQVQQKQYTNLTDRGRIKIIQKSLDNIKEWWHKRARRALKQWKNNVEATREQQNQKKKSLQSLADVYEKFEKKHVQNILRKLKKKIFLKSVLSRSFVQNRAINIRNAFLSIQRLPDFRKINKKKEKLQTVLKFHYFLQKQVRDDKLKIFQIFRDIKYTGNFRKLRSCQSYLKDKISQVHKILNLWLDMVREDKKKRKQACVESLFQLSQLISKSNYSQILESIKSTQLKRQCIERLCSAMQIKKKGFFNIWVSKVKEIRINKVLDDSKKKSILEKINKLVFGTSQENVKKSVRNFYLNYKILSVQVKFIQRLLQTKSGKVLEAFNKWKKIPNQNLMQKYKKGQKFFFKLEGMIKSKLVEVHSSFGKNSEDGNSLKKQAVLQLLQITSSGIRRYYNRWTRITKRDHTLKQAYSMMHSLDAIQHCVAENLKIVFQNERNSRIKTWAIEKLIVQTKQNTGTYFRKWRQASRKIKIAKELQKAQKTTALKLFANVIGGTESVQIKNILEKFHKNAAISKISTNFLNRLLKTKSGKVVQLFQIWKSIPDAKVAKKKKKAIKFQSNLHKVSSKFLRFAFEPFKSSSHEANNKKRICIEKLIRASMGEEKRKFLLWREIIKEEKMLSHTQLFDSLFESMNQKISNSIGIIIKRASSEIESKKSLCRRLISNSNFVQHHSYLIWKQALQVDNIKIQKTESKVLNYLSNMLNVYEKVQNRKLVQVVSQFKRKLDFRIKIAEGIKKQHKNKQGILFFNQISLFAREKVGVFFYEVLKNQKEMAFVIKNKCLQKSFENLNQVFRQNLKIVIGSTKQAVIVQKSLNKIFDNLKISTQRAFNLWREYKNILNLQVKISSQKKKNVLQILGRCLQNQEKIKVPYAISKFQRNYKSLKYRKQMLTKILQCKAGKVPLAFMIWKALPNPNAKKLKLKAMKFQFGLVRLVNKNLKSSYQKFKDETHQGRNKKKNAVRKLILVTMSDSNRFFNKWRKATAQFKITQKVVTLTRFFDQAVQIFDSNVDIFGKIQQTKEKKRKSLEKLMSNTRINLLWAIRQWKIVIKDQKCYKIEKIMQKFEPGNLTLLAIKDAFAKIKNKAEKQTLRAYINSLWKWKMSNVEATYYSKFIKIFKESEELIILSNCLNKKNYENLHCAFRKIMVEGSDRYQRKYRIVEKYCLRKVSNYFQRFKLNACFEQIKTWRNMYKSTIKAKRMTDLIEKIARKQVYTSYYEIQSKERLCVKGTKIIEKFSIFLGLLKKDAFDRIRQKASLNCCNKLEQILEKIVKRVKSQCLCEIILHKKLEKMSHAILKTVNQGSIRLGLMKIQSKALLKSKAKLAIILISYMEEQKNYQKINSVLKRFRKNSQIISSLVKIMGLLDLKQKQNLRSLYTILQESLEKKVLLTRFKKGMVIKKILDQEDTKVLRRYFGLLKKRENQWVGDSVRKFVIRSNLKSSLAVSLWRLQMFEMNINKNNSL